MRYIATLLAIVASAPTLWGQMPEDGVAGHEFPGLQLLPAGSKVKGISLPRYEKHRVSALLIAELMEIVTRSDVRFSGIRAELYAENGDITTVTSPSASYDFRSSSVKAPGNAEVDSARFSARGTGVHFSTSSNVGILLGPVHTTVKNAALNKQTKAK